MKISAPSGVLGDEQAVVDAEKSRAERSRNRGQMVKEDTELFGLYLLWQQLII